MRLGYKDVLGGNVMEFKKTDSRKDLFNSNTDYSQRFFDNVNGLGYVYLVRIKGNKVRKIAYRGF